MTDIPIIIGRMLPEDEALYEEHKLMATDHVINLAWALQKAALSKKHWSMDEPDPAPLYLKQATTIYGDADIREQVESCMPG